MKPRDIALAALAALVMLGCVLQPQAALSAARTGLELFLGIVLPSILPFMVCAWLLIESGAVAAAGRTLDGLMRPVFACPGCSAFALLVSMLSGYPTGARMTLDLYDAGLLNPADARRTGVLASSTGPVFMLGAVGAGLLGSPAAGWVILAGHFAAVLLTGVFFSVGGDRRRGVAAPMVQSVQTGQPAMQAVGDAIKKSVETLWTVGGYILLFSVVTALLRQIHAFEPLAWALSPLFHALGLSPALAQPVLVGMLEMTNGCSAVASAAVPMAQRVAVLCALISWGGLCIQAQSMLYLSRAGVPLIRFLLGKAVQAALAGGLGAALMALPAVEAAVFLPTAGLPVSVGQALMSSAAYCAGAALLVATLALFGKKNAPNGLSR